MNKKSASLIKKQNIKIILAAIVGMGGIVLYYFFIMQAQSLMFMRPHPGAQLHDIVDKAEALKNQLLFNASTLNPSATKPIIHVEPYINKNLLKYVQFYKKEISHLPDLPVAGWNINWHKSNPPFIRDIRFDFNGQLIGFKIEQDNHSTTMSDDIRDDSSEEDALIEAKSLLETLTIKSKEMVILDKQISQTNSSTSYSFTLRAISTPYPNLNEDYRFEVINNRIVLFEKVHTLNTDVLSWARADNMPFLDTFVLIAFLLLGTLIVIWMFIKKLRHDQLDFKWAIRLALTGGVMITLMILIGSLDSLGDGLLGSVISGFFLGIAILILFSVSEALSREIWPEKLALMDLLFQFKGGVRETGRAILHAYFLAGITLFYISLIVLFHTYLKPLHVLFSDNMLNIFLDLNNTLAPFVRLMVISILSGTFFFIFLPTLLRKKLLKHPRIRLLLIAIIFDFGIGMTLYFDPIGLEIVIFFPLALLWAYAVEKWDHFSLFLSFCGTLYFLGLTLFFLIPERVLALPGVLAMLLPPFIFFLGVYLLFRGKSAKDYDAYVPEYVNRIAEKERFLRELEIARGVQMRFLPQKIPQSPYLEIVSLCQPAMEVGGDYFDFVQIDNRYMTVLIGDVSGKGVSAAFYMTMVKGIIKTLSKKTLVPSTLLAEANEIFFENAPRGVFVTIIYGIFDLTAKTLTIASAGHNPLIVWRKETRKTELINPHGLALGLVKCERYKSTIEEVGLAISEGDVFVFYTDGVSEAMNTADEVFGEERLREVIETYAYLSPQQLQEKIVSAVAEFSGKAPQHDDFTMVVVKVRPN